MTNSDEFWMFLFHFYRAPFRNPRSDLNAIKKHLQDKSSYCVVIKKR